MTQKNASSLGVSVEERIEEAFWELIEDNPPERISVVALAKKAHCNRGTFYYYFTDIYDLLDRLIEKNMPQGMPVHVLAYMRGQAGVELVKQSLIAEEDKLRKLGYLLMRSDSGYCEQKLKDSLINLWCSVLGLQSDQMDKSDRLLFEFVASGSLGMMAHVGKNQSLYEVEDLITAVVPEIPQALIARAIDRKKRREA